MKKAFILLIAIVTTVAASAQTKDSLFIRPGTGNSYSADSFRLTSAGPRISLYSFCDPLTYGRAVYFRKDQDNTLHRLTLANLRVAVADNPASTQQLKIAHGDIYLCLGLAVTGIAFTAAGFAITTHRNRELSNAYNQASAQWYAQAQRNPNTPMPPLPDYVSASPLVWIGPAVVLSSMIPLFNVAHHTRKALAIYNGIQ